MYEEIYISLLFFEDFFPPSKQPGNIYILKNFEYYRYIVLVYMKKKSAIRSAKWYFDVNSYR